MQLEYTVQTNRQVLGPGAGTYKRAHTIYSLFFAEPEASAMSRIAAVMRSYFRLQRISRAAALSTFCRGRM